MPESPLKPLTHANVRSSDDDTLRREARAHLAKWPHLQLVAELLAKLRSMDLPWWTPSFTRDTWRPVTRMRWFAQRPDLRQRITSTLTGLPRTTARGKTPEFQADLVDAVLANGDATDEQFENAFDPCDMVVYGPAHEFWTAFREHMPWGEDSPAHQKLVGWLLRALVSERSTIDGEMWRRPILSAYDVRTAIDARVWQERIPTDVRVAIDEARLKYERARPREPYHARHELLVVTPENLPTHVPLLELGGVIQAAERAMGFNQEVAGQSGQFEIAPPASVPVISIRPAIAAVK